MPAPGPVVKTVGVSPKLVWAVIAAVCGYLLTQEITALPMLVELALNVVLIGGAAAIASPGEVVPE